MVAAQGVSDAVSARALCSASGTVSRSGQGPGIRPAAAPAIHAAAGYASAVAAPCRLSGGGPAGGLGVRKLGALVGMMSMLGRALAAGAPPGVCAVPATNEWPPELPLLPELPVRPALPAVDDWLAGLSMEVLDGHNRHGRRTDTSAGLLFDEFFGAPAELNRDKLGEAMFRYSTPSIRAELMRADVCGQYAADPGKALKRCQESPMFGLPDPQAPSTQMLELRRPEDFLGAMEFNAAVLRFLQTHGDHVTLWHGLLPLVATVEDLEQKAGTRVLHASGYFSRVFVDREWLSRNPQLVFAVLCQTLAKQAVHPAWRDVLPGLPEAQADALGKVVAFRIAEEACGAGIFGAEFHAVAEQLANAVLEAVARQHQPAEDSISRASELVKLARYHGDPVALQRTRQAFAAVAREHPQLTEAFALNLPHAVPERAWQGALTDEDINKALATVAAVVVVAVSAYHLLPLAYRHMAGR